MMLRGMGMTEAIESGAPTLATVEQTYGRRAAIVWLATQLARIADASAAQPMSEAETRDLAALLLVQHQGMNLAEFCLFTAHFATGEWGKFYGAADPMQVARALADWARRLQRWKHGLDDIRRTDALIARRDQWRDQAITWEEYQRRKAQQHGQEGQP